MLRFVFVVSFLVFNVTSAFAADLLTYQADGWKYKQVASSDPLIATFYTTSFDDGSWPVSRAAFGNFGELNVLPTFCSAANTLYTQWDVSTDLLLRRYFPAGTSDPVRLFLSIDNDATVYVNGVQVLHVEHGGCPLPDDFVVGLNSILSPTGVNLLAIYAHDRGGFSFVDARITGDFPPLAVEETTWGSVKTMYR